MGVSWLAVEWRQGSPPVPRRGDSRPPLRRRGKHPPWWQPRETPQRGVHRGQPAKKKVIRRIATYLYPYPKHLLTPLKEFDFSLNYK